jgi:hypothetical protein
MPRRWDLKLWPMLLAFLAFQELANRRNPEGNYRRRLQFFRVSRLS